jgi:soluble lytic murein transglycosylase
VPQNNGWQPGMPGPKPYQTGTLSDADSSTLNAALAAVKRHSFNEADSDAATLSNPIARKLVTWAIISSDGDIYSFASLDAARRDLWGWPHEAKRQIAAEKMMATGGLTPQQIVDWFAGSPPQSVEGATQLITAYGQLGRAADAQALAKQWWRTEVFDVLAQDNFYAAFSRYLTPDDHAARLTCLLLNPQSGTPGAIHDMESYVDGHARDVANAVLAMRGGSAAGDGLYSQALSGDPHNPALAFERARYLLKKDLAPLGFAILPDFPSAKLSPDAASQMYTVRLGYFHAALKAHDYTAAYNAMNGGGFDAGESKAEAEFFAGWIALIKLHKPDLAIAHFQGVAEAGTSPITQGRADYWLGRAYEARNNPAPAATGSATTPGGGTAGVAMSDAQLAQSFYAKGGQYIYAFYGQMAAEKAGIKTITLGHDPVPTQADRDRFNSRDLVKAARILGNLEQTDLFRQLVLNLDTVLPNAEEEALLTDMTAQYDSQVIAMKVARMSMQRGFYLPERAYPMPNLPNVPGPEKAFVLAIGRQESGFDPTVRSRANARGVMQMIPSTAKAVSRRLGVAYNESKLYDADYNMTLGSYHLGELVDHFNGSYILAAAGYNAGPSRMNLWIDQCGEPRGDSADALSFIECHPLRETRDYMMRVTENMRIYRARLNGGTAPLTATADVTRGVPAPISTMDDSGDEGDGSTTAAGQGTNLSATAGGSVNGSPVGYLELQKQEAQQASAEAAAAKFAADNPPPPPAPKCHGRHCKAAPVAHGKAAKKAKGHAAAAATSHTKKKKHR